MSYTGKHRAPSRRTVTVAVLGLAALAVALVPDTSHAAASSSSTGTVTVRPGDSLWRIASRVCGSGHRWQAIYRANRRVIGSNPDLIRPGQRLRVSCSGAHSRTSTRASRSQPRGWVLPLSGTLTSCWGDGRGHRGVDIARGYGTPIRAAASGTVTRAGWVWSGYGISVVIWHGGVATHYAHQSRVAVRVGQHVRAGQVIGYVGSTGWSTGNHLHFEVAKSASVLGSQINPAPFLRSRGVRIGC